MDQFFGFVTCLRVHLLVRGLKLAQQLVVGSKVGLGGFEHILATGEHGDRRDRQIGDVGQKPVSRVRKDIRELN